MIEVTGNLWDYPADVRVITTNGFVKKNGECVMGRGCAWEATQRYPSIAKEIGREILARNANTPFITTHGIVTFPVKHNWFEKADLKLIEISANILKAFTDVEGWKVVVMPRPGSGNGKLDWEKDVKPVLVPILDDRFHVITYAK